ncbi:MAG TPA: branched-chain amino acid ABC transporter permease, partial [Bradyrhizobium sp.]|nr:branched-chain amino acid ABC transporter permease [Bradyrhizobium sp.]
MTGLSVRRSSPTTRLATGGVLVLAALLVSAAFWASDDGLRLMTDIFLYIALACLWNFLAGYAGLVSVGQQAYVGLGGYGLFALAAKAGVPVLYAVPLLGALAALLAIPFAKLLFRLRGAYFAIGSWVLAEVLHLAA